MAVDWRTGAVPIGLEPVTRALQGAFGHRDSIAPISGNPQRDSQSSRSGLAPRERIFRVAPRGVDKWMGPGNRVRCSR